MEKEKISTTTHNAPTLSPIDMSEIDAILEEIRASELRLAAKQARLDAELKSLKSELAELEGVKAGLQNVIRFRDQIPGLTPTRGELSVTLGPGYSLLSLRDAVWRAVDFLGKRQATFTSADVFCHFLSLPEQQRPQVDLEKNRANISAHIKTFEKKKLVALVEQGEGRRPSSYRLLGSKHLPFHDNNVAPLAAGTGAE